MTCRVIGSKRELLKSLLELNLAVASTERARPIASDS
jgi:hypothetical protein